MVYYLPFFILILFLKNYINLLQYYAEFLKLGNFLNWTACLGWLLILTCTLECCTTMVMAFLGSCISFNSLNGLFVLRLFEAYWVSKHCTRSPQLSLNDEMSSFSTTVHPDASFPFSSISIFCLQMLCNLCCWLYFGWPMSSPMKTTQMITFLKWNAETKFW